uniref:NT01VC2342 n=1 Tax=Vibrio cholerae non-O1/non-O139 TaxID=156539 RepID=Q45N81_VIBCL|nr:NT01VC2342 [Vibrio cholerae non-O1/non-O139]
MPHNISLNNITPMTAPAQQELSDISLQTTASVLPRVETQPNMSEPALPQTLSLTDSCLENEETSSNQQSEVKKEQAEKKKKVHKKSNKYSNHTKAKGHLAAIAGATTLGAVLAPFTGGLSLLPTAFVVLFGNATALAMYGGSEFVLGQQGANNQLEDKKEPEENKQPEDLVPLPPRPMPTYEFHGFDEIDGRRIPDDNEPGEKGADGKGNTFNYSPVFNFNLNFGDLNINQFNTQNNTQSNTQFNTQNNTYNVNQGGTNPQPTLIEQAIERFGEHPVISVVEITKETLIRELRGQEPIIGSEPEIDEMVDALVSFHEQTNEAKLIQVNFEGGHKAYIGGIPETEELPDVQPVKAEVVVEKEKKQWPEVKPAHRLITTSGNATVASYSGYQNAKVVQQGHTIGYANVENIAKNPQVASTLEFQKVNENQDRKQLVEHSSEQNHVQQGVDGQVIIDSANMQKVTGQQVKKWPEVAPAQRVITSAGNAKVDGNPGYANSRIEVNGQTVGYARSERVGSQSQLAGDARSIATDSHDVEQGQVTTENRSTQSSVESSSTQTSVEQNSVTTQTFVENGTQTEAETSPVKGHHTLQGVAAERVTEGAQVEHAQTNGVKKWPEVAAPQRVITSAGNAKVDGNPGYANSRIEVNGQTVGYARSERVGGQSQLAGDARSIATDSHGVEQGQVTTENRSTQSSVESSSTQTSVEQNSVTTQTFAENGTQTEAETSPVNGHHTLQGVAAERVTEGAQVEHAQTNGVKKWPEVAAPQRVITSAGNAKVDGNPGYANSRIEVDGQTVGYARSERVGSQSQLAGDARSIATDSHDVEQGQVTTENRSTQSSVESSSTQTSGEQNSVTTQTEAETSLVKGHHTLQGVAAERVTEGAQVEHAQTNGVKKWPEVAAPQRVITSAGNAKVDGNPGYANSRIEVDGQTVGYARSERVGSQSQLAGDARSIATDSHDVEQGQVTTENRSTQSSVESSSTQTSVEQNSVTTQTFVENGTQTEAETSPVKGHHTLQGVAAERVTEGAQVEHAQTNGVKKWPEVAAPQRVITSAGNAKVDGNPGYANSRIEVNGQTVGYARSERVGGQSQLAGDARSIATDSHGVEQGQVTTENRSTQSSVESSSTQTSVEQNSVTTQTFAENGTQTEAETSPVNGHHTLQGVAAERVTERSQVEHAQVSVTNIQPEISSQFEVGKNDSQQIQGNAAKVWPEVVPSQRVITSAGNAKVDGNPGYQNSKVDIAGSTYGYQRAERLSSQNSLFEGVNLPQTHQEAEGIKSGSMDVTKLVDVTALPSASETNQSEPRRFVSKLHITLKGKSSADNNPMNTQAQHETLQSWSSNLVSHAPNMKQAQKIVVQQAQNDTELQPKVANLEAMKAPTIVSNITGKKWTVTMPTPVLTTQGMASGRGKNYTQGLFHNIRDINLTKKQLESSLPLMEIAQKRDVSVVTMGERVLPVKPAEISNLKLAS